MSAKDNLNEAMFSMFGVGKEPNAGNGTKQTPAAPATSAAPTAPVCQEDPVTYLAPGSVMEGKLKVKGDVNIAGDFNGDITATGEVILHSGMNGNVTAAKLQLVGCKLMGDVNVTGIMVMDAESFVEGKILAGEVHCAGHIKGDLEIKGNVALKAGTSVEGNITAGTMTMEQGAIINGNLLMKGAAPRKEGPGKE